MTTVTIQYIDNSMNDEKFAKAVQELFTKSSPLTAPKVLLLVKALAGKVSKGYFTVLTRLFAIDHPAPKPDDLSGDQSKVVVVEHYAAALWRLNATEPITAKTLADTHYPTCSILNDLAITEVALKAQVGLKTRRVKIPKNTTAPSSSSTFGAVETSLASTLHSTAPNPNKRTLHAATASIFEDSDPNDSDDDLGDMDLQELARVEKVEAIRNARKKAKMDSKAASASKTTDRPAFLAWPAIQVSRLEQNQATPFGAFVQAVETAALSTNANAMGNIPLSSFNAYFDPTTHTSTIQNLSLADGYQTLDNILQYHVMAWQRAATLRTLDPTVVLARLASVMEFHKHLRATCTSTPLIAATYEIVMREVGNGFTTPNTTLLTAFTRHNELTAVTKRAAAAAQSQASLNYNSPNKNNNNPNRNRNQKNNTNNATRPLTPSTSGSVPGPSGPKTPNKNKPRSDAIYKYVVDSKFIGCRKYNSFGICQPSKRELERHARANTTWTCPAGGAHFCAACNNPQAAHSLFDAADANPACPSHAALNLPAKC